MSDGNGFSAFLQHQFIGSSKQQLLETIKQRGLLTPAEIQAAVRRLIGNLMQQFITYWYRFKLILLEPKHTV